MNNNIPRLVLAGTNSGCGKTTMSCAIMQALVNRGLKVGAFKCGPDYIDPMFHSRIIGAKSGNLDSYFFDENTLRYLFAKNAKDCDINVVEGVMGFYDGLGLNDKKASTYEVSQITDSPVILVVGAKGAALSVLATIHGFLTFYKENNICGVILNNCTEMTYKVLKEAIIERFEGRVRPLGFMPNMANCAIESRHLGLVTAAEIVDLKDKLNELAIQAEKSIDIDGIIEVANGANDLVFTPVELKKFDEPVKIAVARDKAFCFYYEDSIEALKEMGAEVVSFSPLEDKCLPEGIHGLYLGGGYPELYTEELSANESMRASIKAALDNNLPCIAECGGFMYLTEKIADKEMVGRIKGESYDNKKLTRFGYITLVAESDNMLCGKGEEIKGHEFHHWDSTDTGNGFKAVKLNGRNWACVHTSDTFYAGYPHFHFYANPKFAENFYNACLKEKNKE